MTRAINENKHSNLLMNADSLEKYKQMEFVECPYFVQYANVISVHTLFCSSRFLSLKRKKVFSERKYCKSPQIYLFM